MHFSEIIKLQFGKERHILLCISKLFTNIVDKLSSKNAWLPPISFWISRTLVKICFSRIFSKPRKNTLELVGTVLLKKGSADRVLATLRGDVNQHYDTSFLQTFLVIINFQVKLRSSQLWPNFNNCVEKLENFRT